MEEYEGIELRAYLAVIRRWLWLIVLGTVLAGGTALIVSLRMTPIYQAEAAVALMRYKAEITFEPRFTTLSEAELSRMTSFQDRLKALTALVKNSAIASQVIEELGSTLAPEERKVEALLGMVATKTDGELIKILVEADSPQKAAAMANAWARAYEEYINRLYRENSLTPDDIQAQAAEAEKSYQQAQEALTEFLGNNRIDELSREIQAKQSLIASYKGAQTTAQSVAFNQQLETKRQILTNYYADLVRLEQLLADAKGLLRQLEGEAASPSAAAGDALAVMLLRAQAFASSDDLPVQLQISLGEGVGGTAGQQAEDVRALTADLEAQREEIQAYIDEMSSQLLTSKEYKLATSAEDPVSHLIDQCSQEILQLEEQLEREQARKRQLTSARDLAWETYQTLTRKAAEVEVAAQVKETEVRFAVAAIEPANPIKPKKKQNTLLASVVGAMLAVGVSFLIEYLDDSIRTQEDVRRALGLSTLSRRFISTVYEAAAPLPTGADGELITVSQPRSPTSEGFRALRTQLQIATDKPLNTLLVTSPSPLEGKSTVVANLGIVMAQAGWSTILVDSDMRRPVLHEMLGLANAQGLSNTLSGDGSGPGQHLQATGVENLRVLTSGPLPPNPSELLSSSRMEELIQQLRGEADILLFDSPAALPVTDAVLLAKRVDRVLLVVESGVTRRGTAQQTLEGLTEVGANLVGVVLNRFSAGAAAEYYYHEGDQAQRRRKSNSGLRPLKRLLGNAMRTIRGR